MNHGILVVVSDTSTRRTLERALTDHGHQPVFASGPDEAMVVANRSKLRLCVIDLQDSPVEIASDLAEEMLASDPTSRAIIIREPNNNLQSGGKKLGQIQHLQRPFSMLEFISRVDSALTVWR